MSANEDYLMSAIIMAIGAFVIFLGFIKMRKWRIIKDTPRSKIRSMAMGIVEIHGSVEADQLIKSPFSKTDCVYYKWEIKEYRKDSSSKKGSSSYTWRSVSWGERSIPFFARDDTGRVLIDPHKGEFAVEAKKVYYQKDRGLFASIAGLGKLIKALKNFDPNNPDSLLPDDLELTPMEEMGGFHSVRPGDRKYYEHYILPGDNLFVLGTAANSQDAPGNVVIKRGRNEKTFIISDKKEKGVLRGMKKLMVVCFVFGSIFFVVGAVILLQTAGIIGKGN